jgi:hypothetical protein
MRSVVGSTSVSRRTRARMSVCARFDALACATSLVAALGCGGSVPIALTPDGSSTSACPTHDAPTFELGTGERAFEPLVDGQRLAVAQGPQGGCHLWLAVRTDGFAERLFEIAYTLRDVATGTATGDASRLKVRLAPSVVPGRCEYVGYTAFLVRAGALVGRRVAIRVQVEDDLGRTATQQREVEVAWPEAGTLACP